MKWNFLSLFKSSYGAMLQSSNALAGGLAFALSKDCHLSFMKFLPEEARGCRQSFTFL
ncbi:MAG: hypothetical protein RMJ33_08685 [Saprospiraceae bacterium]|nr:hypothetical protein [Saprospiraceae bacterium]MDW8229899.1 hypothetical protein [Saprospiraceae bacterium]